MARLISELFRAVWIRILSAGVLVVGWLGYVVAPGVQEQFFPVIAPGSAKIAARSIDADGWTSFSLTFRKNYDCKAIEAEWFYTDPDGLVGILPWHVAVFTHSPSGQVRSPPLMVLLPSDAVNFFSRVVYDCGQPWRVYSTLGPFPG